MAVTVTTPTRMELARLKGRLRTAQRGHKLLRDKRDGLLKRFLEAAGEARALREEVEAGLARAHRASAWAAARMGGAALEQALMYPAQRIEMDRVDHNLMGVCVPRFTWESHTPREGARLPYGFASTSGELDDALGELRAVLPAMLKLAQLEKTVQLLAWEIERTRRRVNALEQMVIPRTARAVREIAMKLEENGRAATTRMKKVKEMLLERDGAERRDLPEGRESAPHR